MNARQLDHPATLFIGIGAMGEPMAGCLAGAGYDLLLSDADGQRAAALAERLSVRAVAGDALATVAGEIRTVVLMLPSSRIVEAVLEGDGRDGLFSMLEPGTTVIDMSSSAPASTQRLAALAEALGLSYLDAPVSGGVPKARTGELAIMVGGRSEDFASSRELLQTMGGAVTHVGGHGAGHALKALNNLLSAVGMVAAAEVLSIATSFGIETRTALDVINGATGRNQATEVKYGRYVLSRTFDSGFSMNLMVKDLRTALDLAHGSGLPVPMSAAALEEWTAAFRDRGVAADHTEIAAYVERRSGLELLEQTPHR